MLEVIKDNALTDEIKFTEANQFTLTELAS